MFSVIQNAENDGAYRGDCQELARAISTLRKQQKISQQTMADHLFISRATINALENGRTGDVCVLKVMKVLDYLGCELAILSLRAN